MRKLLLLSLLLLFSRAQVKSQIDSLEVIEHMGKYNRLYFSWHEIAGVIGENICELYYGIDDTNLTLGGKYAVDIIQYDKNTLEYKKTITLNLVLENESEKEKGLEFNNLFILDSSIIIVSSRREGKKTSFYGQLYDFNFKPLTKPIFIAEEVDTKTVTYQAELSDDKKSFSFATIIGEYEIGAYLVSTDLKLIAKTRQKGGVYLQKNIISPAFSAKSIENSYLITTFLGKEKDEYKVCITNSIETIELSWGKKGISYSLPNVIDYSDGIIKVSSFYYSSKEKLDGVTTAFININTKQIESVVYSEFTNENLNKNNPYKKINYSTRNNIRYVDKKDNGDIIITGDDSYITTYTGQSRSGPNIYYHFENIIAVVLDENGNIKMQGKIARNSVSSTFAMYDGLKYPLIFYLDNRKNYKDSLPREKPKRYSLQLSDKKKVGVCYSVTDEGISRPYIFFRAKKNKKFIPTLSQYAVLNENEIVFFSRRGNRKYVIYKLKFHWQE